MAVRRSRGATTRSLAGGSAGRGDAVPGRGRYGIAQELQLWLGLQPRPSSQAAPVGQAASGMHDVVPSQRTLHAHAFVQSTPPMHELFAVQLTTHGPSPQIRAPRQALRFEHSIWQTEAEPQLTPREHESWPWQRTRQGTPGGQTTTSGHDESAAHSKMQTPWSQRVHPGGHTNASGGGPSSGPSGPPFASALAASPSRTHQPSTQRRPAWQSAGAVQANCSLRRSTEQAPSASARTTASAVRTGDMIRSAPGW